MVICDVIMPGRDGYDVCQKIKSSPDYLHLPVILLTGTFEPFDRDRALAAGCSEIITKPFEAKAGGGCGKPHRRFRRLPPTEPAGGESDDLAQVTPPPHDGGPRRTVEAEKEYEFDETDVTADSDDAEPLVEAADSRWRNDRAPGGTDMRFRVHQERIPRRRLPEGKSGEGPAAAGRGPRVRPRRRW